MKKYALVLAMALAGCGGGGGGDDGPAVVPAPRIASVTVNGIEAAPRVTVCAGTSYPIKATFANPGLNVDRMTREVSLADGTRTGDAVDLDPDTAWYAWSGNAVLPAGMTALTIQSRITLWDVSGRESVYAFDLTVASCQ